MTVAASFQAPTPCDADSCSQARRTSELFVVDKNGTVVYHGGVDDSRNPESVKHRYLQTALDEVLAGKPVTVSTAPVQA